MTTQVLERPHNQPADPGKQSQTAVMALTDSDERLPSALQPRRQPKTATIEYPDSDGKPMAETAIHVRAIMYLYDVFEFLLKTIRADLSIYLAADMFLYYQEGNPRANKSPDLMLIKGVDGSYQRRSFKTWVEHAVPAVIIEVSSKSTWIEDMVMKASLYARLGVKEYFIFDPLQECLPVQLVGFRLEDGEFVELAVGEDGGIDCHEMEVRFTPSDDLLLVTDLRTGKDVPAMWRKHQALDHLEAQLQQTEQRAEQEAQRAADAAAENQRLRALLEQFQSQSSSTASAVPPSFTQDQTP